MEEMTLQTKLDFLKQNKIWKCMNKTELLGEHNSTWKTNGIIDLNYTEEKRININDNCIIFTVDVLINEHWTDLVCGIDNTQLEVEVNVLKSDFLKLKSSK
jgi:hypothetical protein